MDLATVRTFVTAAEAGQFQEAAPELAVTQQAVSKRIAALERTLGIRLFTRTPRGAGRAGSPRCPSRQATQLVLLSSCVTGPSGSDWKYSVS